ILGCEVLAQSKVDVGIKKLNLHNGLCGESEISFAYRNYSAVTLTNVAIYWSVNEVLQPPYFWKGNLLANSNSEIFQLGTIISENGEPVIV
ncbi:hypothetical protein KK062_30400, partial [Fulvivirgaceae bacterium PWU5]